MKWNYSADDRMLRHESLDKCFCMNAFHTTKSKSLKLTRQNTCCQPFVTDNSYICVCALEKESDVLLTTKSFSRLGRAHETLVMCGSKSKTIAEVKRFCAIIDTALKTLEYGIPCANIAKLRIEILKSRGTKDTTESNSPLGTFS